MFLKVHINIWIELRIKSEKRTFMRWNDVSKGVEAVHFSNSEQSN